MRSPGPTPASDDFPTDVFDSALEKLETVLSLELVGEEADRLLGVRATRLEQTLEQLVLIRRRVREDGLAELDAYARISALVVGQRQEGGDGLSSEADPEYRELMDAEHEAETALWVDWKRFFIFGEILLGDFALMSEVIWDAPPSVIDGDGVSRFSQPAPGGSYKESRLPTP